MNKCFPSIQEMDTYMDKMGRKALLRKEQSHMKINKVKDGIYPAKITSVYIASKKKVIFDLEIKVKRKKKVEGQVEYYLKKGKNKALMKIIQDMGGLVKDGVINLERLFKCRFMVQVFYNDIFDILEITGMRVAQEDYLEKMEDNYYDI